MSGTSTSGICGGSIFFPLQLLDLVWPFDHVFMSQVRYKAAGLLLVSAQTYSSQLHIIMDGAGINLKYEAGLFAWLQLPD